MRRSAIPLVAVVVAAASLVAVAGAAEDAARPFPVYRIDIEIGQIAKWTARNPDCLVDGNGQQGTVLTATAAYSLAVGDKGNTSGNIHPGSTSPAYGNSAKGKYAITYLKGDIAYRCYPGQPYEYSGTLHVPLRNRGMDRPTALIAGWAKKSHMAEPLCPEYDGRRRRVRIAAAALVLQPPWFGRSRTHDVQGLFPAPPFHCAFVTVPARQMLAGRPFTVRTIVEKTEQAPPLAGYFSHELGRGKSVSAFVDWDTWTRWTVKFTPCRVTTKNYTEKARCPGLEPFDL